jgi:hypothetical protein
MPEVPKFNDVGTLLRFFPQFLRVEMYELRRNHGSHNFHKSAQELHGFYLRGSLRQGPFNRPYSWNSRPRAAIEHRQGSCFDRWVLPLCRSFRPPTEFNLLWHQKTGRNYLASGGVMTS